MQMTTAQTVTWYVLDCVDCGVLFAVTDDFDERRREDKKRFHCPNGHGQSYTESEADRLRKQLAMAEGNLKFAREQRDREREATEKERNRHAATKGVLTKTRKRVAGGACPCCNRSFVDLARHMSTKHPGYAATESKCWCDRSMYQDDHDRWHHHDRRVTSHPAAMSRDDA